MGSAQEIRIQLQEEAIKKDVWQCCLNCDEWNEGEQICNRFRETPPITTIVVGCKYWLIAIPF